MKCGECSDRLEAYTDRELTDQELVEVRRHLDRCPPCEDRFRFQAELKRVVRVCCEQESAPSALREKLKQILY